MKRQILPLLFAGMGTFLATSCCCPKKVAVVKKAPVVLAPTGPILVKEYTIPARPVVVEPATVVVVTSNPPPQAVESAWYFTGIRWVWLP
jgi:hypothetical protein